MRRPNLDDILDTPCQQILLGLRTLLLKLLTPSDLTLVSQVEVSLLEEALDKLLGLTENNNPQSLLMNLSDGVGRLKDPFYEDNSLKVLKLFSKFTGSKKFLTPNTKTFEEPKELRPVTVLQDLQQEPDYMIVSRRGSQRSSGSGKVYGWPTQWRPANYARVRGLTSPTKESSIPSASLPEGEKNPQGTSLEQAQPLLKQVQVLKAALSELGVGGVEKPFAIDLEEITTSKPDEARYEIIVDLPSRVQGTNEQKEGLLIQLVSAFNAPEIQSFFDAAEFKGEIVYDDKQVPIGISIGLGGKGFTEEQIELFRGLLKFSDGGLGKLFKFNESDLLPQEAGKAVVQSNPQTELFEALKTQLADGNKIRVINYDGGLTFDLGSKGNPDIAQARQKLTLLLTDLVNSESNLRVEDLDAEQILVSTTGMPQQGTNAYTGVIQRLKELDPERKVFELLPIS